MSGKGHAFIDRALYLPRDWTQDPVRLAAAHAPQEVSFATKPRLALDMAERAIAAGVPFSWVVGDLHAAPRVLPYVDGLGAQVLSVGNGGLWRYPLREARLSTGE